MDADSRMKEKSCVPSVNNTVRFIIGCTDSEDDESGEGCSREYEFLNEALYGLVSSDKTATLRRCVDERPFVDRNRLQSESSSGVSTHYSSTDSNNSSNCSIVSGLSSEADVNDDSDPVLGGRVKKTSASVDMTLLASTTNEGVVVEPSPPLMKYLVVNPSASVKIVWSYAVVGGILVANAPTSIQKKSGLNEALITLLEYGENDLRCSRAVVLIERNSPEKEALQRMFSFLGFTSLKVSATPPCLRPYTKDHFLMVTDFSDLQENDSDLDLED